MLTVKIAHRKN